MQLGFAACAYVLGLILDVLIIGTLLRQRGYRRHPFIFIYVIVDLLTTVIEIPSGLSISAVKTPEAIKIYGAIYWWNERIIQVLVFLIVISLVYRATSRWEPRRSVLAAVVLTTLAVATITFFIHYQTGVSPSDWMDPWTRDLNFCAAILDLGLWAVLIASAEKDYTLLMISGALGIQFTGGAIGHAFRDISHTGRILMGDLMYLANLACLYIWWQAFRLAPAKARNQVPLGPASEKPHFRHSAPE
ncbi:MAG TPA: hypothetical protein VMJ75_18020 [Candidatus Acidoferrales bacterium]|nr:hypothetical protein [Candidatus Acidoferrales bacterium]